MKKSDLVFSAILVPIDYIMIVAAAVAAYFLRYERWVQDIRPVIFNLDFADFMSYVWLVALGWLVIFAIAGMYQIKGAKKVYSEVAKVFLACSTGLLAVIVAAFFSRELFDSRFILIAVWILSIIFVSMARSVVRIVQRLFYLKGFGVHKIVVVGSDESTEDILAEIYKNKKLGFSVVARFKDFTNGNVEKLKDVYGSQGIDEIVQADASLPREEMLNLLEFADSNHITFKYTADFFETKSSNIEMHTVAGVPIVEVKRTRLDGWGKIIKRFFDIVVSLVLLVILIPVFLILALIVKVDSKGPVFYSQVRIGSKGEKIKIHKFRSMIQGADGLAKKLIDKNERKDGPLFKMEKDPRITRVGKFTRRLSLDELPQLFDVLLGKMSLVGPRPHLPAEVAKYESHHKKLLNIKPGISGMAQVSGRSDLKFEDEVRLDVFYIENWSLGLDFIIMLKTPWVVLRRRGAK